ncbi:PilW family protein [Diaphorobacter aerolatus]|uniref:PilW family protein n=1 Tax=Diaphorobacter aerolatus TaxID=1288495 RepID=UPI0021F7C714|nr:PilW family protein [Diaphorobacter aerolatus]
MVVADGVKDVHFEFGVDTSAAPEKGRNVDEFKSTVPVADEVIRSLRYAILMTSNAKNLTQGMASSICTRWTDAGGTAASCDTSNGQLYQLATGTLMLRNLMP